MSSDRIRVFIVDDHPLVREWLGNLLRLETDIELSGEAEEPIAALAAMEASPPDVAVVDLSLKRGSGMELIKDLHAWVPDTRVLVLSMHEEIGDVERALRAGALGYVMKRESTNQIVAAIRQVYAGHVYAEAGILSQLAGRMMGRAARDPATAAETLSDRELEVFRRLGEGHTTRRIADDLGVSQKTVQTYCARIKEKFGLNDGTGLVQAAIRWCESKKN
jgi:DNA-binding NarL/FixJ family response regulator